MAVLVNFQEPTMKRLAYVGFVLVCACLPLSTITQPLPQPTPKNQVYQQIAAEPINPHPIEAKYVSAVTDEFNINKQLAQKIVAIARQNAQPVFPKTQDILAIIGVESSFRPNVKSKLRHDPAYGLMQVRPGVWRKRIDPKSLQTIEGQIQAGVAVLSHYYTLTHTKTGAVMAYNVGITAYLNGRKNWRYVYKYHLQLKHFEGV
jgi:uncharacterized lipoprotein YajG